MLMGTMGTMDRRSPLKRHTMVPKLNLEDEGLELDFNVQISPKMKSARQVNMEEVMKTGDF